MPRVKLPPTPSSSLDIQAQEPPSQPAKAASFALPPPAMASVTTSSAASRPQPILPAASKSNFELPPPPTRSRRIIQMEPAPQTKAHRLSTEQTSPPKGSSSKKNTNVGIQASTSTGKKQPSSTSAAGKKMARKTAHSVIERRRRSKMNEEFSVLKAMIPACKDQEMHKLAILSAGIEYVRYLEKCVSDLQMANNYMVQPSPPKLNTALSVYHDDGGDEDHSMTDTPTNTTHDTSARDSPKSMSTSPAFSALHNFSSYASSISTLPSPAFGPAYSASGCAHSQSTSPTMLPGSAQDADHEATAALLMLNKDRRDGRTSTSGRSMSVKDLLSPA